MPIQTMVCTAARGDEAARCRTAGRRGLWESLRAAAAGAMFALLFMSPARAQAPIGMGATAAYVTRAGDTLYDVALRYLADARAWRALAHLNHVSAPRRLPPGMTLRLPLALLRRDAVPVSVVALSGLVTTRGRSGAPDVPLLLSRTLGESDTVSTGPDGFATLELDDGSYVSLTPNSCIALAILRKMALTGIDERVIELKKGEVTNEVTHAKQPGDRFEVRTPAIVAGVRGTRFRVNVLPSMTAVEVLDGKVAVGATANATPGKAQWQASESQFVEAGQGSATPNDGAVGAARALLPAPRLRHPSKVQDGRAVAFDIEPASAAVGYRVQIARDADLLDLIREARVQAPSAVFPDLPDGTYFVRVSAIDAAGLEGLPRVYAFERRANEVTASAAPRADSHDYRFVWRASRGQADARFRFVLSRYSDLHDAMVDAVDLTGTSLVVSDLQAGDYYWRVIAEQYDKGRFYETPGAVHAFTLAN